ncbi:Fungal Zn(2)-Cys(6) binuclear cluster domain-containing protein [Penicillium ucsense]|uniref:Fungal Zn(2)-Cys(6) binuclear cluster domain-containing protein n=1 Tax=Penicillium ucsense TaxID=2839758 RepID=A0A8J8WA64_9EURO|nr:Fungal Zn(2)-Cys(6) binuclear cluster domain-containing protein [Penicillium ucsense]KAF7737211.1 Fungal Zn(2)-Cys(6) binuclear cluster domain-containing protein [Penicillium ucsense]
MPGVPSGRACDACRRQKKKCDEAQPTCGRCLRLKIVCQGSGKRRFKFQEERPFEKRAIAGQHVQALQTAPYSASTHPIGTSRAHEKSGACWLIPSDLTGSTKQLASAFLQTIDYTTDFRWNIGWSFGPFLYEIPRRLGSNEALDRAAEALTSAHADLCSRQHGKMQTLAKYTAALRTLRVYLEDPVHAHQTNTFAAVMLLLICHTMIGQRNSVEWSGHAHGAIQILKARRNLRPRDPFEAQMQLSLSGTVLFENIFNKEMELGQEEWETLIILKYDVTKPEGRLLLALSRVKDVMSRAKLLLYTGTDTTGILDELWALYIACKLDVDQLRQARMITDLSAAQHVPPGPRRDWLVRLLTVYKDRLYGLGIVITLIFNSMLQSLDLHTASLQADAYAYTEEILWLNDESECLRPVGSGYMILCLTVAWVATTDLVQRETLTRWLYEYQHDFNFSQSVSLLKDLKRNSDHLRLGVEISLSNIVDSTWNELTVGS